MDTHHAFTVGTLGGRFEFIACREGCSYYLTVDHHTGELRHIHDGAPGAMHVSEGIVAGGMVRGPTPAGD